MTLKDRIKEAIVGSEKSKADVARACGVTNAAVTHWVDGSTHTLKADTALALEEATGYRARWILYAKGPKKSDAPYWPFSVPIDRYEALSDKGKGYVEGVLEQAIKDWETRSRPQSDSDTLAELEQSIAIEQPKRGRRAKKD
jgi:transcriptional regulator with XRE-family HTH domain